MLSHLIYFKLMLNQLKFCHLSNLTPHMQPKTTQLARKPPNLATLLWIQKCRSKWLWDVCRILYQGSSHSSFCGHVWSLILLPLCRLSNTVFVCALTYRDSSSHHKKTITTIFLVMRLSAGTQGYGTHIQTSHDMTHPTEQCLQICA